MMNFNTLLYISCLSLLTACNDNFSAGVSLGGTGTGDLTNTPSPRPRPENRPNPTDTPDHPDERLPPPVIFNAIFPETVRQNCHGIQRSLSFIDHQSHELKTAGSQQPLNPEFNMPNDIALSLEICNTTSHQIYEYVDQCQSPLQLIDETGQIPFTIPSSYLCEQEESIHLYQPYQCKQYRLNSQVRSFAQHWRFRYQTQYSFNMFKEKQQRTQCETLETRLNVIYTPNDIEYNQNFPFTEAQDYQTKDDLQFPTPTPSMGVISSY